MENSNYGRLLRIMVIGNYGVVIIVMANLWLSFFFLIMVMGNFTITITINSPDRCTKDNFLSNSKKTTQFFLQNDFIRTFYDVKIKILRSGAYKMKPKNMKYFCSLLSTRGDD